MTRSRGITSALIALACIAGAAGTARASALDPFRAAGRGPDGAGRALDPFRRVAQALPAVPAEPAQRQDDEKAPPPQAKPTAPAPAASTPAPAAPPKIACQRDEDCPEGNICQANACKAIELSTNLFPIYYREGTFKQIALVYWSRKGNPGYTVVFPFYWHFYSPTSETRFIAPFYWHSTDSKADSDLKVVLLALFWH